MNIHEAETSLSQLVELVENGERVVIVRGGIPIVELVCVDPSLINRRGGQWKGKARIADEFDAPTPDVEELFNG